jgi:hypothetical protein
MVKKRAPAEKETEKKVLTNANQHVSKKAIKKIRK